MTQEFIKPVYAVICNSLVDPNCAASQQATAPKAYFNSVIQAVITIFMLVTVLYFLWFIFMAGFHYIENNGDSKMIEQAKNQLQYGLMGLAIVFSVFAILKFIGTVFGISGLDILQLQWPTI
jgi:hypothetical protein